MISLPSIRRTCISIFLHNLRFTLVFTFHVYIDGDSQPPSQTFTAGKVKNNTSRKHVSDKDWTTVGNKNFHCKSSTSAKPISPNLQHIINNHPILNISNLTFDYNKLSPPINEPHVEPLSTDTTLLLVINNQNHTNNLDNEDTSIGNISSN